MQKIEKIPLFGKPGSVVRRLVVALLIVGTVATLIATAVQSYTNYYSELSSISSDINLVASTHVPSLSAGVWNYSENRVRFELAGILDLPGFEYVEVTTDKGEIWGVGKKISSDFFHKQIPLVYSVDGKFESLGTLSIWVKKHSFYSYFISHTLTSLVTFGMWVIALTFAFFIVFRQLVTRHLSKLASYTSSMTIETSVSLLTLDRKKMKAGVEDELGQVVSSINAMHGRWIESIEELRKSEELYRQTVEGTQDLITIVDGEGRFLFVNHMSHSIFGMSPEDCVGKLAFGNVHPEDRISTQEAFQEWLDSKLSVIKYENRQVSLTGSIHHISWHISIHYGRDGKIVTMNSTGRDITTRKGLEDQLRRSQKMDAVG
ncbi:MAG: PAS domain S-box protein, partial [Sneathiella sp.]